MDPATCDQDCTIAVCGDGLENELAGEECDDGNGDDLDTCANDCKRTGLVAHWPLSERIGGRAWDNASWKHHAELRGAALFSADGSGVVLDGVGQWLEVSVARAPHVEGAITMMALVRADPAPTEGLRDILSQAEAPTNENWLRLNSTLLQVGAWWGPAEASVVFDIATLWNTPKFHHVVGRHDGKRWAIFHDGILVISKLEPTGALGLDGSWYLGGRPDAGGRFFAGQVREFRLYDRAVSNADIEAIATRALAPL
jgi:hypothetical protein